MEREKKRTGRKLSQKEFVIGLIERELEAVEQREAAGPEEDGHADVE